MEDAIQPTLIDGMLSQPPAIIAWLVVLGGSQLAAIAFVVGRVQGSWRFRPEAFAILASFMIAGQLMEWLHTECGYVRLLGLAHLVFWTPVYAWVFTRRRAIGTGSVFGKYVVAYLVIAGISLAIDALDVVRYALGDTGSLNPLG